jgi:hypothetical protein
MIDPTAERLLAAGAALGDLDPAEDAAWAAHRAGCADCRILEDDLAMTLADLSLAVPQRIPPPDLLDAVRRSIGLAGAGAIATPAGLTLVTGGTAIPGVVPISLDEAEARDRRSNRWRPRGLQIAVLGLAAGFALAVVGLGARSVALQREIDRAGAQVAGLQERLAGQDAVLAAALDPGHVAVTLLPEALAPASASMVMYVPGTSRAFVVADGLPATPSGQAYELWYADAAGVHPLQTMSFDGVGTFVAPLDVDLSAAAAVMVTLEAAGGATGDPGPQVVFGEL